jgi:FtsH-binding integral membrane protein
MMTSPFGNATTVAGVQGADTRVATFLRGVYGWMFVGLLVTAAVAFLVASQPALVQAVAGNRLLFIGLIVAELALVWFISARVDRLTPAWSASLFLFYAALNGVTLSIILLVYTGASIATAFLVSAAMFGALAVYGTVTKRSLDGVGSFVFMGLIGLIVASIVNLFLKSSALQFVLSVVGVIVFTGLTAYDAQKMRRMALAVEGPQAGSYAVGGALSLYLDFINLFLFILRFFGRRD